MVFICGGTSKGHTTHEHEYSTKELNVLISSLVTKAPLYQTRKKYGTFEIKVAIHRVVLPRRDTSNGLFYFFKLIIVIRYTIMPYSEP
jgi:hypothetical protein